MKSPLRILHLEDDLDDATLALSALETAGITCVTTRVEDRASFVAALDAGDVDLVLSDVTLPAFDGLSALNLVRDRWPDLPVIVLSGTVGEEQAIDSLKNGATDYVLKHRPLRLGPAVRRAMQDVEERAERGRLQAQFIEAQKMEVVGQLAGGVAHDFSNILGVIIGYSDLLTLELGDKNPLLKYTEEIRHAADRAAGLTRQLLIFSSKGAIEPRVLDLNAIVKELDRMLRRLIDENIQLEIADPKPTGRILADAGYLGQVLMNLVVNARDAMPYGGRLTIDVSDAHLDGSPADGGLAGDFVALQVSDTGMGMTEEVKERLFEAFFTTKPRGKGTGLGLATCRTIVKQSGGTIKVESEVGRGTTFRIYFPRVEQRLEAAPAPSPAGPLPRGTETLLVVEDEPSVRHLVRDVLEAQGYTVLSASNGQDALHVARDHRREHISLAVTDLVMPIMGGKVMAEWLKTSDPELKILFTSGYTDEHGVLEADNDFLPKPYTPSAMVRKVREMLDRQKG